MSIARKIQVEVSEDVAEYIHRQVATGGFADESAVVQHALEEASVAGAETERWLRNDVLPVLDRMDREGWSDLTSEDVLRELRDRSQVRASKA